MSADTLAERIRDRARQKFGCNQCAGSGRVMSGGNLNACYACSGRGIRHVGLDELIAFALSELSAAEQAARKEEREQCCKDVCHMCNSGLELYKDGDGFLVHKPHGFACSAWPIGNRE